MTQNELMLHFVRNTAYAILVIILGIIIITLFACKQTDIVTYSTDGWAHHSIVQTDTTFEGIR